MKKKKLIIISALCLILLVGVVIAADDLGALDKFKGEEVKIDKPSTEFAKAGAKDLQELVNSNAGRRGTYILLEDVNNSRGGVLIPAGTELSLLWIEE